MTRKAIYSGSPFEELAGYSRAVVDGDWIFVSGTAGYDPEIGGFDPNAAVQTRRALDIIAAALAEADSSMRDIVSVRINLASRDDVNAVSRLIGQTFSYPRPTHTTVIVGFAVEEIKVELEVIARRQATTTEDAVKVGQ